MKVAIGRRETLYHMLKCVSEMVNKLTEVLDDVDYMIWEISRKDWRYVIVDDEFFKTLKQLEKNVSEAIKHIQSLLPPLVEILEKEMKRWENE